MSGFPKMDFRFADGDDAPDIERIIQEALKVDSEEPFCFRRRNHSLLSISQIENECNDSRTKWVVLETPVPEEAVVAVGRLSLASNLATVNSMCAVGECVVQTVLLKQLIAKLENVSRAHGCTELIVEVPEWREDLIQCVTSCGYEDKGGYISADGNLIKPTMILQFKKFLRKETEYPSSSILGESISPVAGLSTSLEEVSISDADTKSGVVEDCPQELLMEGIDELEISDLIRMATTGAKLCCDTDMQSANDGSSDSRPPPEMELLFQDMFRALHNEYSTDVSDLKTI